MQQVPRNRMKKPRGYYGITHQDADTALSQDSKDVSNDNSPSSKTTDFAWRVVISGVVAILVGASVAIVAGAFLKLTDLAPLITVFTTAAAFLGGLLAPSPVDNVVRSIGSIIELWRGNQTENKKRIEELENRLYNIQEEQSSRVKELETRLKEAEDRANSVERHYINIAGDYEQKLMKEQVKVTELVANILGRIETLEHLDYNDIDTNQLKRLIKKTYPDLIQDEEEETNADEEEVKDNHSEEKPYMLGPATNKEHTNQDEYTEI